MNYRERFEKIILEYVVSNYSGNENNDFLKEYISKLLKTTDEWIKIAIDNEAILKYFPERMKKIDIYLEVVRNNGRALMYVPKEMQTPEMYVEAVRNSEKAIYWVPEKKITLEVCREAVNNNGEALKYVPDRLKTPEMCLKAIKDNGRLLENVPQEMITLEMCQEAVKNNGKALIYVPDEMKTSEMCLEAVKNFGRVLRYVPQEMKTLEMCKKAVENDGKALEYVPKEMQTPEMYMEAVENNGMALEYIPKKERTQEICLEAVKSYGLAIMYVPDEMKTSKLFLEAVKNDGEALIYIPNKMKTLEECLEAVKNYGRALQNVPQEMKTIEICEKAVENDGRALEYVPDEMKTSEMCLKAVKKDAVAIIYVPEKLQTVEIVIEGLKYRAYDSFRKIYELVRKADKFNDICHFVPILKVLEKYPESQIEKFNKKIWFNLAQNDLFNTNLDTKCALVEAVLSLGAFDKGSTQQERISFIQKMATNIPKEEIFVVDQLDDFINKNFKVIGTSKRTNYYYINKERLLSDPNIINLFGGKERTSRIIENLQENILPEKIAQILNSEEENDDYRKVLEYIYKTGYDKVEGDVYAIKLAKDIQAEKIKDKRKGEKLEKEIREFYYSHGSKLIMTPSKIHRIFDGMDMQYRSGFYEFFKNNYEQILTDSEKQSEISKIQRQWDKIVEANLGLKVNFEKCEAYIYSHEYENIGEDELEIAKLSSNCGYSQEEFEKIQEIFASQKERTKSSIPQIERKDKKTGYTYKVLRLDDPTTIFVGELTDCCQALGNAGESCMRHGAISPNGRVLVVEDENGKILSQSWIWRNKNTICFDNIEAVEKDSNNKKIISSDLFSVIKGAAKDFIEADKIEIEKWKQEQLSILDGKKDKGEISEQEYNQEKGRIERIVKGQRLTKVTVGVGNTDVDLKGLEKDNENKYPEEFVTYISDSRKQLILYEDKTYNHQENSEKTVAMYSDGEGVTKLIDVDTSEILPSDDDGEDYYDDDEDIEDIGLQDIRDVMRNVQNRSEAREALQNIEKWIEENNKYNILK